MSYANQDQLADDPAPVVLCFSGRPGTWPGGWCCPRSTGSRVRGCCPGSGGWWATAAATSRTRASVPMSTMRSPNSAPSRSGRSGTPSRERVFFAGGGFTADSPGSLPGVLGEARRSLGGDPQLIHYLAVPPVAFAGLTKALASTGSARAPASSTRSRSAHRGLVSVSWTGLSIRSLTSSRCTGSTISWGRKPPRTCTCCASPTGRPPRTGTASTSSRCRSTCPRRSASATGRSSTTPPARCWTCSSRTCSRWPPRSPWNPRPAWARSTCRPPGSRSSAASGRWTRPRWCSASSTATGTCPGSIPSPAGTPSSPPGCGSTAPAGVTCRSTCVPASGWPHPGSGSA